MCFNLQIPGQRVRNPEKQKLRTRDIHFWDIRRGQPTVVQWKGLTLREPPL